MANSSVTVIVTIYNKKDFLRESIDSLLQQSFSDIEILIIDNQSDDGSYELCCQLYEKNDNVKIVRNERNMGWAFSVRKGIALAKGEYIAFLDGDDIYLPQAIEIMYGAAEEYHADVVEPSTFLMAETDERIQVAQHKLSVQGTGEDISSTFCLPDDLSERIKRWKGMGFALVFANHLYRTEFLRKKVYTHKGLEDVGFVFQCVLYAKIYVNIPEAVFVYRIRSKGWWGEPLTRDRLFTRISNMIQGLEVLEKIIDDCEKFPLDISYRNMVIDHYFMLMRADFINKIYREGIRDGDLQTALRECFEQRFHGAGGFIEYLFRRALS